MPKAGYTPEEMMTVAAARKLTGRAVCFVGIGLPSAAANLARITHAPEVVLIYESGTIGAKPHVLPLSIGDGELADTADTVVSVPEIFRYWLQGGRVDVGFLGAAQIDKYGQINTTIIGGSYEKPKVRLPGAGGDPEIATSAKEVWIVLNHSKRNFVDKLAFVTSSGYTTNPEENSGARGRGPTTVITDLGVMDSDPRTHELILMALHPGVELQEVTDKTRWDLKAAEELERTAAPTEYELRALRDLHHRTSIAHGAPASGG
ncbi:MAG: CoA-transferase subunit beta [Terracidiphilus sp.]|jgi:glutaconate CoA-transferase subunit B